VARDAGTAAQRRSAPDRRNPPPATAGPTCSLRRVSARARINAALTRLTGYHFANTAREGELVAELQGRLDKSRRQLSRARQELAKKQQRLDDTRERLRAAREWLRDAKDRSEESGRVPGDIDGAARRIIRAVRPYTMTNADKVFGLIQATRYATRNKIEGDIVECGVGRGGNSQAAAHTLLDLGDTSRDLYLFDTFEGLTPPSDAPVATLEDVEAGFDHVLYPREKVHYVVGAVADTVPDALPERIAILRLDTESYESTKHELEHAYPRLTPGGILIVDGYGQSAGTTRATDEFVERLEEPLLLHRLVGGGRIAVKPFQQSGKP
jgi:O-methyltransferase